MKAIAAVVLVLALAGCSTPKQEPTATKTQTQIEAEFIKAADDSCNRAKADDVIESVADGSRIIAVSQAHAYKSYSAVYVDAKGASQLVYELDLIVCGPSYLLSMQKEANHDNSGDYEHHIKLNADGTYTWTQHSYGTKVKLDATQFTILNGYITHATTPDFDYSITFGPVGDADLAILKVAVDAANG